MIKKTLQIKGMHCASCASIITNKVSTLRGVNTINVNFATEKANISFDDAVVSIDQMNNGIEKLGYTFIDEIKEDKVKDLLAIKSKMQFVLPISLLVFFLMLWDIGAKLFYLIPNLPLPMSTLNIISMIFASIILFWIGQPFLQGVVRFVKYRVANMDTLIGIGTLVAYLYSMSITLFPTIRTILKLPETTYFDVTIVVIGFVILGKYLEARSKLRTGEAIEKLLDLQAKTALLWRNDREVEIPINEVKIGDILIVKPGSKIPVDGIIIEGFSSIDESMITGESIPVDKKIGNFVIGATINKQGNFKFKATKIGSDTMLAQIIKMVEDAQGSKAPIQAVADKISSVFVPTVLLIALSSLILWLSVGVYALGFSNALSYGIISFVGVLIIACPCALGLATPTAIIVGVGKGAENGILIRDAEALEKLSHIDTVVFDKTGTITKGEPEVTDIISLDNSFIEVDILRMSASIEKLSEHPLANAIVIKAEEQKINLEKVENFQSLEGIGVEGTINNKYITIHKPLHDDLKINKIKELQEQGKTVVIVEIDKKQIGIIALSDTIKEESKDAIAKLHERNIKVIMLTGDNHLAANYISKLTGIDVVIAEVLPQEKALKIKELQDSGAVVLMVGDGINDAPSLVQADVGIAMSTGTDVAIESAGMTLLGGDISKITKAIKLSKMTMKGIKQNLFWAFIFNIIGIPLAAGLFFPLFGWSLNPVFAGLAMAFSSVFVVSNSLRIKTKKL
ncbi:MAG: heavy metal translocating P-type ATPase [Burkholderiales bacterium]|nr:heavy metal translocating P-type ATPase [Burkholderiales bacterium]